MVHRYWDVKIELSGLMVSRSHVRQVVISCQSRTSTSSAHFFSTKLSMLFHTLSLMKGFSSLMLVCDSQEIQQIVRITLVSVHSFGPYCLHLCIQPHCLPHIFLFHKKMIAHNPIILHTLEVFTHTTYTHTFLGIIPSLWGLAMGIQQQDQHNK